MVSSTDSLEFGSIQDLHKDHDIYNIEMSQTLLESIPEEKELKLTINRKPE